MQYFQTGENNSERRRVYLHLVDATDGITAKTGESSTCKLSFNGRAVATSAKAITEIDATNQPGTYYLELSTSEIQFPGVLVVRYKSASTAEFVQTCQIMAFDPYTQFGTLGGGVGPDIDYKRIKKLVDEAVGNIKPTKLPEPVPTDLTPILSALKAVQASVKSISIPEAKETDLSPVLAELKARTKAIIAAIDSKEIPVTDLSELASKLDSFSEMNIPQIAASAAEILTLLSKMKAFFGDDMDAVREGIEKLQTAFESSPRLVIQGGKQ